MVLSDNSATTPCPDCGNPMPMVSWVGDKPSCNRCVGSTFTERFRKSMNDDTGLRCLHEDLPDDAVHMVACPCPMCSPQC